MPPTHFTVSQVRSAAACARILYFDAASSGARKRKQPAVTRIWKAGRDDERTACGALFHAAVERFNRRAAADPDVRQAIGAVLNAAAPVQELLGYVYRKHVNRAALYRKSGTQQQAFMETLQRYLGELVDILVHARAWGKPLPEVLDEMFGDRRRRVDVTFQVGPQGEEVHVSGILDYVFYDWRTTHNRIIDYKLAPADRPETDLFQVCIYALMHHVQHHTEPDVGVLYLYPQRHMIEKSWDQVYAERHKVFNLLASMREWVRYSEATRQGLRPPGEPLYCPVCKWRRQCVPRLGPLHEGQRLAHWTDPTLAPAAAEPRVTLQTPSGTDKLLPGDPVVVHPPPEPSATPKEEAQPQSDSFRGGLPSEDELWLGARSAGQGPVGLPCRSLATHVAVVGAAGSGKTWLAKIIAEEAVDRQVAVLAVDPQGDLVQLIKPRVPGAADDAWQARYRRYWQRAAPRIWTPGTSHGIRLCLSPVRLPSLRDLTGIIDEQRRREEWDNLLTTVAGNLVSLAKAGGDADCQRTFVYQILQGLLRKGEPSTLALGAIAAAVGQPEAAGLDNPDLWIKKAERERVARKLNSLIFGPAANLFSGGTVLDLDELLRPTQPGQAALNVLYLNALADDDQKQFFVAALATEIYRWMVTHGSQTSMPRLLFYLDEARDYIPAGTRKPPAKEPLLRLFAQGRKYGIACLFCTQSPRSVDYNVFGNCSTKLIGRLESSQDVERVADWFGKEGPVPAWLRERKGAEASTFVGRWPGMAKALEGQTWATRCLFSEHGGAWSPDRVEQETRAQVESFARQSSYWSGADAGPLSPR